MSPNATACEHQGLLKESGPPRRRSRQGREALKRKAAIAAVDAVAASLGTGRIVGVGTGSTTNHFIDALAKLKGRFDAAVASSVASAERLAARGIRVIDLNDAEAIAVYVDGADEVEPGGALIKGGGGAHTREKIVAAAADRFICIVDDGKMVEVLGAFGVPVEVVPMARRSVARRLRAFGGEVRERAGFVSDNGNAVLDLHGLAVTDPDALEAQLNNLAGVVENGIFAVNRPHLVLVGSPDGVREFAP